MRYIVVILSVLLSACGSRLYEDRTPPISTADRAEISTPLRCKESDCGVYWKRAQVWILQHSDYKVRLANDVEIETFGPHDGDSTWAYRITRIPGQTEDELRVDIVCGHMPVICRNTHGSDDLLRAQLYRYARTGQ